MRTLGTSVGLAVAETVQYPTDPVRYHWHHHQRHTATPVLTVFEASCHNEPVLNMQFCFVLKRGNTES